MLALSGSGTLTVAEGGAVSNTIGYLTGEAMITGAGSQWTNSGDLYVAEDGSGMLTVTEGARVSSNSGYLGDNSGRDGRWR